MYNIAKGLERGFLDDIADHKVINIFDQDVVGF